MHSLRDVAVAQFGISGEVAEVVITTSCSGGEVAQDGNEQELTCPGSEPVRILGIFQLVSEQKW